MIKKIKKPSFAKEIRKYHVAHDHKWAVASENPPFRRGYKDDWKNSGGQRTLDRKSKLTMTERREEATGMHE